ncbi:MAG: glucose-6-phosphate isomerase [Desulfuromonas sp.]|nr:MAG: glucose-6-phosphate isomerase [Desulfuromonas sp.]
MKLDYANMMADVIGPETGIEEREIEALQPRIERIHEELMSGRQEGRYPFYTLPGDQSQLEQMLAAGERLAASCRNLLVLGIGGSALGTTALFRALADLQHNLNPPEGRPRLFVLDNVDPVGIHALLAQIDPAETRCLVISKSGSTVETMSQFLLLRSWLEEGLGSAFREQLIFITDPHKGGLRQLAEQEGVEAYAIPDGVGGRFSVFTPVGLLPLAAVGVDISGLLAGAEGLKERLLSPALADNPAYLNAVLQFLAYGKGLRTTVMMAYSDQLRDVADWFRQLWAESLGKKYSLDGKVVHAGPTPVNALGTTDQHSQVQLYMEGPFDKTVTLLAPECFAHELELTGWAAAPQLDYLQGKSLGQLMRCEQQATAVALAKNRRSNCTLTIPEVSPESLGQLLFMFEVQTVFAGGLFGVDPLDQPGVEEGKEFTYALMGRSGYEQKLEEFRRWSGAEGKYRFEF